MDSKYYELRLQINPDMEDLISEIFFENFDCEGIVLAEEAYKDLEMISTTEGTLKIFLRNEYGDSYEDLKYDVENVLDLHRQEFLSRGLSEDELGSWEFELEEKETEDWSKKWKEQWDVTHVTNKIAVVPDWIEYQPKDDEVIIKLEPGCAFGTGTHQTTQLCMKALEKYMKKGDRVADIGMGSGILSILAKKLGASYVYGCDNDDTVIEVAKENARKNGVECEFELGTADKVHDKFDFVCANILHFVLAEIMGDLKNLMKTGALMSLSGILDEKKQMVIDAYQKEGLELVEEIPQDQWTSFVVKRVD
ncbi:MAG: 50S ribosomal protein L11 methyltransferase [Candidatus Melainabacteria bacterium]|nr:MAG: 50S ribosomal protein L11 methyltransferase [Candidatus Melainabacteria bacterium]